VFKLAPSNFRPWGSGASKDVHALEKQLELHMQNVLSDRSPIDVLYEILLRSGFDLATQVEKIQVADKTVYRVADGLLVICLERNLTLELLRSIAVLKAERIVCLDEGFAGNDQLKANAVQMFRNKGTTSFRTV
jgi:adenine-specific DNA-methyltransferase